MTAETTNTQHTPGPWIKLAGMHDDRLYGRFAPQHMMAVATIDTANPAADANARLIAAAPALLATLEAIEWSATIDVSTGGNATGCPSCGGGQYDDRGYTGTDDEPEYPAGHSPDCMLLNAIEAATGRRP